jgi:hypothetical protein
VRSALFQTAPNICSSNAQTSLHIRAGYGAVSSLNVFGDNVIFVSFILGFFHRLLEVFLMHFKACFEAWIIPRHDSERKTSTLLGLIDEAITYLSIDG